jgi:hypothetical protein
VKAGAWQAPAFRIFRVSLVPTLDTPVPEQWRHKGAFAKLRAVNRKAHTRTGIRMFSILFALQVAAQTPPVMQLQSPERVFPVDFTQIRGVRELPDGRVLISDRLDKGVVVADFTRGTIAAIGRTGSGPAEYRLPTVLTPMPGDSTLLVDEGNQRLAVIGPDLRIHRSFNLIVPGIGVPLGARAVDRRGLFYLQIPGWVSGPRGAPGDTIVVVRYDPRSARVDTLARIKGSTPRRNTQRAGIPYVLFAAQDVWNVTIDGRLGVVRSGDYHVDWHDASGRVTSGPRIAFERRPVTLEDRMAQVRRFMEGSSISGKGTNGGLSPLPAEMLETKAIREVVDHQEHAEVHAPFTEVTPLVGPDGSLWVERSVRLGTPQTWDVVGADGALAGRLPMPAGRRLISLGARWLYAVATDDDGLQYLERYRHPAAGGRGRDQDRTQRTP